MYELIGVLCILLSAVFFSMKAIFVKLAYQYGVDPVSLLTLRMVFSLPFFVLALFFLPPLSPEKTILKKDYFWVLFLGIAGYYLASILDFWGLQHISAGLERLILFLYPTFVVLLSIFLYKKKLSRKGCLALALTYFGLGIVFFDTTMTHQVNLLLGSLFVLGSALAYAFYLTIAGDLIPKFGALRFTSYALIVSSLSVFLHYVLTAKNSLFSFSTPVYYYSIALGLISTVIPTFLVAEGIKRIGSSRMAIVYSIGPVTTIVLGNIFLGETIGLFEIIGTVFVIAGVVLVSKI